MNLEKWKKFFSEAGIPNKEASTYGYQFYENRIQLHMLLDLNKDYLKEMGITIMGDVIAILKHAKLVYDDFQKNARTNSVPDIKKDKEATTLKAPKKTNEVNTVKPESKIVKSVAVKRKSDPTATIASKKQITPAKKQKSLHPELNNDNIEECEDLGYIMVNPKKDNPFNQKLSKNVSNPLSNMKNLIIERTDKITTPTEFESHMSDDDDDDDNVEVIINDPMYGVGVFTNHRDLNPKLKDVPKATVSNDSIKRKVFKRLGEEISQPSVSSTTPFDDDDNQILNKKTKEAKEEAKAITEKNSVFHRLGNKCDVTSTSTSVEANDKLSADKKVTVKSETKVVTKPIVVPIIKHGASFASIERPTGFK